MALSISGAGQLLVRIPTALFPIALGLAGLAAVAHVAAPILDSPLLSQAATVLLILAAAMLGKGAVVQVRALLIPSRTGSPISRTIST